MSDTAIDRQKWCGLCVHHDCEPCKNGRIDQVAVWGGEDSHGPQDDVFSALVIVVVEIS